MKTRLLPGRLNNYRVSTTWYEKIIFTDYYRSDFSGRVFSVYGKATGIGREYFHMDIKSFFRLKFVLFAIVAIVVAIFLGRPPFLNNPVFWFTLIPSSPLPPNVICTFGIVDYSLGWPLSFLRSYGGGCTADLLLNPISLLLNFGIFLIIGRLIFKLFEPKR